jgi:hypothetical protein
MVGWWEISPAAHERTSPMYKKKSQLTLDYLIKHALLYARSMYSDIEMRSLSITWNDGQTLHYTKEIIQDLPCFRRMIAVQKVVMGFSLN